MLELDRYLDALKAAKQWGLHAHMKGLDAEQRLTFARRCVSAAAAAKDEETAIQQFDLLRLAIDDVYAPALKGLFGEERDRRMSQLDDVAKCAFAAEAASLWMETPAEQEARFRPGENLIRYEPTLVEYKRKLMEVVVGRWRETNDDVEAASLLDAIVAVMKRDLGAYDFLPLAIRETKEYPRHRDRTLRGILRMSAETSEGFKDDPAKAFLLSFVRSFGHHEIRALGAILQHLPLGNLHQCWASGYPATPLLNAMAREGEAYRKMHDVICELRSVLKPSNGKMESVLVEYPHQGQTWMTIMLSGITPDVVEANKLEKVFRDTANGLHQQARHWLKKREAEKGDAPLVSLIVTLKETTLTRTFEIG